ncbi:endonuclease, partial, partial [Pelobates cultripes]
MGDNVWSDHVPVTLTTQDAYKHRGEAPWRLNNTLLHDEGFKHKLQTELTEYFRLNDRLDTSPTLVWQAHKAVVRGQLISRAAYLRRISQQHHLTLLTKLRDLKLAQFLHPKTNLTTEIELVTKQLNDLLLQHTARMMQTLKMKTYTQGNKDGKKLASLLRHQLIQSKIPYLLTKRGEKIYNPLDINAETAVYYQTLYNLKDDPLTHQPSQLEIDKFLRQIHLNKLTQAQKDILSEPITLTELQQTIRTLPSGKSPGPDGFT